MQGNHRMAILAHLNYRKIQVRSIPQCIRLVRSLTYVDCHLSALNRISLSHLKDFLYVFNSNGHHINLSPSNLSSANS